MVTLEFTTQQIEELKNYYKTELDRLLSKAVETQKIIDKLDVHPTPESASISAMKDLIARGEKIDIKKLSDVPEEHKSIKGSGKKEKLQKLVKFKDIQASAKEEGSEKNDNSNGKWIDLIVSVLKEKASPMSKKEILKEVLKRTNQTKTKKIDTAITMSIYRLRAIRKEVISEKIERRGKKSTFYSLASLKHAPVTSEEVASPTKKEKKNADKGIKSKTTTKEPKNAVKIEKPVKAEKPAKVAKVKAEKPAKIAKVKVEKPAKIAKVKAEKPAKAAKKVKAAKIAKPAKVHDANKSRSVLTDFVVSTFQSSNKILQAKDIVNLAITKFNLPEEKKGQLRLTIAGILYRGEKTHGTIKSYKEKNLRGSFYGLTEWFEADGSLQKDKR